MRFVACLTFSLLLAVLAFPSHAEAPSKGQTAAGRSERLVAVPEMHALVTDTTGTLDATQIAALTQKLDALAQERGAQIAILMVPTTGKEAIEPYATRVFDRWKLGREAQDDGLLLLIALKDRRMRIEVGQGLEGQVPDLAANRIIEDDMKPHFKRADYFGGIDAAVDALVDLLGGGMRVPSWGAYGDAPETGTVVSSSVEDHDEGARVTPAGWAMLAVLCGAIGWACSRWRAMRRVTAGAAVVAGILVALHYAFGADRFWPGLGVAAAAAVALVLLGVTGIGMRLAWQQGIASFALRWAAVLGITGYVAHSTDGELLPPALAFGLSLLFAFFPGSMGDGSSNDDDDRSSSSSSASGSGSSSSGSGSSSSGGGGSSSGGGASGSW